MARWLLIALLMIVVDTVGADAGATYRIQHLEPASWWVGMKDSRLQIMVHGERIAELEPAIQYSGVSVERVKRTENPNYLFVDLQVAPDVRPGPFRIDFRRDGKTQLRHDYVLHAREPDSASRAGFGPSDTLYLVTPDRFANGDPSNDQVKGLRQGVERRDPDGRHGGDLQGILDNLDYIAGMGFTQIWLNPVLENDQPQASYHGYAITDFYKVDARYGDNELFRKLSHAARRKGIGMIMDVIPNHCGSEHWWMKDLPGKDWINNGGTFVANSHNRESLHDPHGTEADRRSLVDGWFVPTMPDLNQRNPLFATYLIQNAIWWIEFGGLSGLRVDTWPYSDREFLAEWTRRVTGEYPNINIVGEEWSTNPAIVAHWQKQTWADGYVSNTPSLMDFPLQSAVVRGLVEEEAFDTGLVRIYSVLTNDFLYSDPGNLVVFPDNHDMNRLYTQLGERLDLYKMAVLLIATTRGIPQFYYGSEILKTSPKERHDGLIRSDFPGGWAGDAVNGFTGAGLTAAQKEAQDFTRGVLNWRKRATAVHGGKLTQYAPEKGAYVWFRHDQRQKLMFALNKGDRELRLDTARFHEAIGSHRHANDIGSGRQVPLAEEITVPARGMVALELRDTSNVPTGVTGQLERHEKFQSQHVEARNVDVWLPPGYSTDDTKRYPVLYMHDGQNLFDPALSYTGIDWGVDETMTRLIAEGAVREAIVVGVWNSPNRLGEYMPQKAVTGAQLSVDAAGTYTLPRQKLAADAYLRLLVEDLMPFIDSKYRTLTSRDDTFIMGSSMGGLICVYALVEYPDVFGGAGAVSTAWPIGNGIAIDYFEKHLPAPSGHKFYFDFGTETLDATYEPFQRRVDALMRRKGYTEGKDWITRKFEGAEHNEAAWRARVEVPLAFFLGK